MRRGTTLEGYVDRENRQLDSMSVDNAPSLLLQRWHEWVELECTKRYEPVFKPLIVVLLILLS